MPASPNALSVRSESLSALGGITHGYFTRKGGTSSGIYGSLNAGLGSGDERVSVVENRRRMTAELGTGKTSLATPYQVHSADAVYTDQAWNAERPKADAVVTDVPGLAVGIVTADCGPVLFADPVAKVVGAAHAGWKGAVTGIMEATIETMIARGARKENILAVLGPTISAKNYEVGPEFPAPFLDEDAANDRFFTPSKNEGHHMFDLPAYIVDRLTKNGVKANQLGQCTYELEDQFYSYRRTTHRDEPDYGRQLSAIIIV